MKKLIKPYLFFALIFAVLYLGMPIFFQGENYKYDAIEYQFVFPAAALLCGLAFSWKRGVDFTFPLIAPIIYIGSVLIYHHFYHWMIYVFIYLIVGMLGCFIGDMVYKNNLEQKRREQREKRMQNDNYKITISNIRIEKDGDGPEDKND